MDAVALGDTACAAALVEARVHPVTPAILLRSGSPACFNPAFPPPQARERAQAEVQRKEEEAVALEVRLRSGRSGFCVAASCLVVSAEPPSV